MDRPQLMRANYDSARMVLEPRVRERPDEARFRSELGIAYAGLGRNDDALREGEQAVRLQPVLQEAVLGPDWVQNLARIYVMLGMVDSAVDRLEYLLSIPSGLSGFWLHLDPIWTPLRYHAQFQALLERY